MKLKLFAINPHRGSCPLQIMKAKKTKKVKKTTAKKTIKKNRKGKALLKKAETKPPKPKRLSLRSAEDILGILERTTTPHSENRAGDSEAKTVAYLMQIAGSILKTLVVEKRLDELEKMVDDSTNNNNSY